MKKLIVITFALFSFASFAQYVRPSLAVFDNYVQVSVVNSTQRGLNCSGFVYVRTRAGHTETHFYSDIIYRGQFSFRNYYIRRFTDRYISGYDTISCRLF